MKEKFNWWLLVVLAFCLSVTTGCFRAYKMKLEDMHVAPIVGNMPDKFTVVASYLNPVLDLSEGFVGYSWPARMWNKNSKGTELLALNIGKLDEQKRKVMLIVIPLPLEQIVGNYYGYFNRCGSYVYNHLGEYRKLKSLSSKIDINEYKDFLPRIERGKKNVYEVNRVSPEFNELVQLFTDFRIKEINMVREYIYKKYGSNLTKEQLQEIAYKDSVVRNLAEWLGSGWYVVAMVPWPGIVSAAIVAGLVKVFQLPSVFGDKLNQPGYMEYVTDAETVAKISLRALSEYGTVYSPIETREKMKESEKTSLPADLKQAIKDKYGIELNTYEEYNLWAIQERDKLKSKQ